MSKLILTDIINNLPKKTGVYQFFDQNEKIIYVGKAKNLKNRVTSYFKSKHKDGKTNSLVKQIKKITHIVVKTV